MLLMRAEMERTGAERAAVLVVCSLLLKTLRSLLMRMSVLSSYRKDTAPQWGSQGNKGRTVEQKKTAFVYVLLAQPAIGQNIQASQTDG